MESTVTESALCYSQADTDTLKRRRNLGEIPLEHVAAEADIYHGIFRTCFHPARGLRDAEVEAVYERRT